MGGKRQERSGFGDEHTVVPDGKQVKSLRQQRGWSQEKLSEESAKHQAPISRGTVKRVEGGKPVFRHTLLGIAHALVVPFDALVLAGSSSSYGESKLFNFMARRWLLWVLGVNRSFETLLTPEDLACVGGLELMDQYVASELHIEQATLVQVFDVLSPAMEDEIWALLFLSRGLDILEGYEDEMDGKGQERSGFGDERTVIPDGKQVKHLRQQRGWSRERLWEEVAKHRAPISRGTVKRVEDGKPVFRHSLLGVARALAVPFDALVLADASGSYEEKELFNFMARRWLVWVLGVNRSFETLLTPSFETLLTPESLARVGGLEAMDQHCASQLHIIEQATLVQVFDVLSRAMGDESQALVFLMRSLNILEGCEDEAADSAASG